MTGVAGLITTVGIAIAMTIVLTLALQTLFGITVPRQNASLVLIVLLGTVSGLGVARDARLAMPIIAIGLVGFFLLQVLRHYLR